MADSVSIKVPYRNLKEAEVEMVEADELHLRRIDSNSNPSSHVTNSNGNSNVAVRSKKCSLFTLILSCTVAAGVQFGWALQLSLLTPYVQTLGIEHAFSSFIWLCGPITGLVVQPCVGIWSDKCTSKYGRRRPFILAGSLMISVAVMIIGFSADIGYIFGDTKEDCRVFKGTRTRAALVFIIGFWMLDLANNTVQGPARALLADLSGPDQRNSANAIFCSWMAVGNILGFSAGASGDWHRWFPFLTSRACCAACGNLKAAFLVAVVFLTLCTLVTIYFADEVPLTVNQPNHLTDSAPLLDDPHENGLDLSKSKPDVPIADSFNSNNADSAHERDVDQKHVNTKVEDQNGSFNDGPGAVLVNLLTSLRHLPPSMHAVLIVMALSWLSWFPFFLFDTDWMGREVYHGDPKGNSSEVKLYDQGVREGAFGLLLNSVVLGVSSFLIQPMCQRMGASLVWAMSNFIVFACMAGTAIISLVSVREYSQGIEHVIGGSGSIKTASLVLFALLGFPLAITYSVPFAVTAQLTADSGGGQGLAIGVLNLAIVVPQEPPITSVLKRWLYHLAPVHGMLFLVEEIYLPLFWHPCVPLLLVLWQFSSFRIFQELLLSHQVFILVNDITVLKEEAFSPYMIIRNFNEEASSLYMIIRNHKRHFLSGSFSHLIVDNQHHSFTHVQCLCNYEYVQFSHGKNDGLNIQIHSFFFFFAPFVGTCTLCRV